MVCGIVLSFCCGQFTFYSFVSLISEGNFEKYVPWFANFNSVLLGGLILQIHQVETTDGNPASDFSGARNI
jgi:hypothetical protein